MKAAWLIVLAGCGAAAIAPPARPTTTASLITALEAAADRACACADRDCAAIVEEDLQHQLAPPTPPLLDDPAFPQADAAIYRGIMCLWDQGVVGYAYAQLSVQAAITERDETCACHDATCAPQHPVERRLRAQRLSATPMRETGEAELEAIDEATTACAVALVDATPYVTELLAIRDRACGCGHGDVACGRAALDDLTAWGKRYETTEAAGGATSRLQSLAAELGECVSRTGAQAAP